MEGACREVYEFWWAHGMRLESENGSDTFKYELVQKMGVLHGDIVGETEQVSGEGERRAPVGVDTMRGKIGDIVSFQRRHIVQFEFCVDEFNQYLTALRLLDVMLFKT